MVHELILTRRSYVGFSEREVGDDLVRTLFEAARWAPSSMNSQPWRFIYGKKSNPEQFEKLFNCLLEGNQRWNKYVPMLILTVAEMEDLSRGKPVPYALHDVGLATENLLLQAFHLGLAAHPMGGFDKELARKSFGIPANFAPVAMIAVGYRNPDQDIPEDLKNRETATRKRKNLEEIVSDGMFTFD